jgi:hypothetical protein
MVTHSFSCVEGSLVPIEDHAKGVLIAMILIAAFDQTVMRAVFKHEKTRWFALHCITNAIISATCCQDLANIASTPLCGFIESPSSWLPSYFSFALHLYHLVAFTSLRGEDVVHHLLFGGCLGAFNFTLHWGRMTNFLIFFMTGLPGGIDYALLVGVKTGRIKRLVQKRTNSSINTWLRAPGHVACSTLMAVCCAQGFTRVHPNPLLCGVMVGCVACLTLLNGLYYGEQAVGTYHRLAALSPTFIDKQGALSPRNKEQTTKD